jgi:hypothetical protein
MNMVWYLAGTRGELGGMSAKLLGGKFVHEAIMSSNANHTATATHSDWRNLPETTITVCYGLQKMRRGTSCRVDVSMGYRHCALYHY